MICALHNVNVCAHAGEVKLAHKYKKNALVRFVSKNIFYIVNYV